MEGIDKEGIFYGRECSGESLVNSMSDGALILDLQGNIVYTNPALISLLGYADKSGMINKNPGGFTGSRHQEEMARLLTDSRADRNGSAEVALITTAGNELSVSVKAHAVKDASGNIRGSFVVVRDDTERKKSDREIQNKLIELMKSNDQLKNFITQIKTMEGLIKICVQCKRICTDSGEWQQLEHYISEHTNADFTHGMCAHCADQAIKTIKHKNQEEDFSTENAPA
jgi:PAS domain S-box-containing protein